jgi:hypothetical protein
MRARSKENLESKATNVITVSGFMITLLFSFSAFVFQRSIETEWIQIILIFSSIIFPIIALWLSLRLIRISDSLVFGENIPYQNLQFGSIKQTISNIVFKFQNYNFSKPKYKLADSGSMFCRSPFPTPIALLTVILVSISLFAITYTSERSSFAQSGAQSLDKTYTNPQCGISMNYPSDWIITEFNEKSLDMTSLANFKPSGAGITLQLEATDISAYAEADKSVEGLANIEKEDILLNPEASIEQSNTTEVSGIPAYRIVYNNPITPSDTWKILYLIVASNNTQYTLRFTATSQDEYGSYVPVVDNMIKSIKIDGSKKC